MVIKVLYISAYLRGTINILSTPLRALGMSYHKKLQWIGTFNQYSTRKKFFHCFWFGFKYWTEMMTGIWYASTFVRRILVGSFFKPRKDRRRVGLLYTISFAACLAMRVEVLSLTNQLAPTDLKELPRKFMVI